MKERGKKTIHFQSEVCTARFAIIHFRDDFYIHSRDKAKYQMCPSLLTGNDKGKKYLAQHEKDWKDIYRTLSIFKITKPPQQRDLSISVERFKTSYSCHPYAGASGAFLGLSLSHAPHCPTAPRIHARMHKHTHLMPKPWTWSRGHLSPFLPFKGPLARAVTEKVKGCSAS